MGLFTILSFVISMVMQMSAANAARKRQKKLEKEAKERADAAKGFQIAAEGEASLLPILYGRGLLGGVRVFHNTSNTYTNVAPAVGSQLFHNSMDASRAGVKHEYLTVQTALCFGDIQSCQMVMVDGRQYDDIKYRAIIGSAEYLDEGRLMGGHRIHFNPTGGVVDPLMSSNYGILRPFTNVAYATSVFSLNRDDYQYSGIPELQFMCEGLKVSTLIGNPGNLRLSQYKTYSNNPALCLLDYLMSPVYGRGLNLAYIDLDSFYYAAKVCDTIVLPSVPLEGVFWANKGGTRSIKLYECNLALSPSVSIRDNTETILETMGQAELIWSGGKYKLSLEYPALYTNNKIYNTGDVVQYISGTFVDIYRAIIPSTSPALATSDLGYLTDPAKWVTNVIAAYLTDDDIIRSTENTVVWPNASERYNFCTVRFLNEAKDFIEDSVSWPFKAGTIPGPAINRGIWSVTAVYGRSDITTHLGVKYQCKGNILYSGNWDNTILYVNTERVLYTGNYYTAKNSPPVGTLPTNVTYWTLLVNPASTLAPPNDPAWVVYNDFNVYNVYREEDQGLPLEADFFESGITDYYHALAKAEQRVRFSRASTVYRFPVITKHTNLEPGDLIKVTSTVLNIPGEIIRIEEIKANNKGNAEIIGSKFDARTLAWNANDNEVVKPRIIFSNGTVEQCTALSFTTAGTNNNLSSGKLSWTPPSDIRVKKFIIKFTTDTTVSSTTIWKDVGSTTAISFELPSMLTGSYILTVIAETADGKTSPRNNGLGSKWPELPVGNITSIGIEKYIPITVYARKSTTPTTPVGGIFSFQSLTLTVLPTSNSTWSLSPPAGVEALYGSRTIASTSDVAIDDTTLTWTAPVLYSDSDITVKTSKSVLPVGLDFDGNNAIYTEANGRIEISVGGTSFNISNEATYSIFGTPVNCSVNLVILNGDVNKGKFSVVALNGIQGTFVVRAVFRGKTYDFLITVISLKDVYIKDLTPPPTPVGISVTTGLSTVFITSSIPSYTVGHGHEKTLIYGAIGATSIFADATVIGDFTGAITSIARNPNEQLRLWFKYLSKDGGESALPFGGLNGLDATTLTIGATDFANTIRPVFIFATLPILPSTLYPIGSTGVLTTTGKLYRNVSDVWVTAVATSDLSGVIADSQISAGTISGNKIKAGSITAAQIAADTITAGQIAAGAISASELAVNAVTANAIAAGAITADKLTVADLAAVSANLGVITAGNITLDTAGFIKGGQTAYATGNGFFLGYSGINYKFSIGNAATGLRWDGASLFINGTVDGGLTLSNTGHIKGGQTAYNTGNGFFLGYSGSAYKLSVGLPTSGFTWDGTTFNVNGPLIATGNLLNNAITNAVEVYAAAINVIPATFITVISSVFTTTGMRVLILASFDSNSSIRNTSSTTDSIKFELLFNGVVIASTSGAWVRTHPTGSLNLHSGAGGGAVAFNFSHIPVAGTHTYEVRVKFASATASQFTTPSGYAEVSQASLFAMEIKR